MSYPPRPSGGNGGRGALAEDLRRVRRSLVRGQAGRFRRPRQSSPLAERPAEQEFDLAVETPQIVVGPMAERIEDRAVHAQ
jgi:hypothetical protein